MAVEVKTKRSIQPKSAQFDLTIRPLGLLRNARDGDLMEDGLPLKDDKTESSDIRREDTTVKPNSKKVIQLPMLKLNLDSLTGSSYNEDNFTLESTRKTLRTLIDDCKRSSQTTEIKNYEFISPVNNPIKNQAGEGKIRSTRSVNKYRQSDRLPPLKHRESDEKTRNSVVKTPDAICSVALTNQVVPPPDDQIYLEYFDGDSSKDLGTNQEKISSRSTSDMASWNAHSDSAAIRKGSFKGCSKHEYLLKKHRFQRELMEERIRARQDLNLSWVKINHSGYKASPIYQYTSSQVSESSPQLPVNSSDHCPMCALYRSDRIPTACPPNSPRTNMCEHDHQSELPKDPSLEVEDKYISAGPSNHFTEEKGLEPVSASKLAQKQGFRGSKPPITFKMAFCK